MLMLKKVKGIVCLLLAILLLAGLTGCEKSRPQAQNTTGQGAAYPITITDDAGRAIVLDKQPQRIVSLSPSHTEILFALGLGERVAGVTTYCDYPLEAQSKPKIGGFSNPSVEKIIETSPDLVLAGDMHQQVVTALEAAKIKVLVFTPNTMEDIFNTMTTIGKAAGEDESTQVLVDGLRQRVAAVTQKVAQEQGPKPRVFYEVWHEPLMGASQDTLIGELIKLSGGENIIGSSADLYPMINEEIILEKDPEIMMHSYGHGDNKSPSSEQILNRPGWQHLTFVKNKNVVGLEANLVNRYGPRSVDALEQVARAIHPELFK